MKKLTECEARERALQRCSPVVNEEAWDERRHGTTTAVPAAIRKGRTDTVCAMRRVIACAAATAWLSSCGGNTPTGPTPPPPSGDAVLVGAGDIAWCSDLTAAEATAKLLDATPGTIFTAGDNVYDNGSLESFQRCYEPNWGRHKNRTRPSPGNHEYDAAGAAGYFAYFGSNAGPANLGYYSYNLGTWHIVSLNSLVPAKSGSAQLAWLESDLSENQAPCTLAYWHFPLFSSGQNGPKQAMQDVWRLLYDQGVDVVLSGDDHLYERFGPQDPDGRRDPARGIRQFTVGTGGAALYQFVRVAPNSEVRFSAYGVLKLTLRSGTYDWEFLPVAGGSFRDFGTGPCH